MDNSATNANHGANTTEEAKEKKRTRKNKNTTKTKEVDQSEKAKIIRFPWKCSSPIISNIYGTARNEAIKEVEVEKKERNPSNFNAKVSDRMYYKGRQPMFQKIMEFEAILNEQTLHGRSNEEGTQKETSDIQQNEDPVKEESDVLTIPHIMKKFTMLRSQVTEAISKHTSSVRLQLELDELTFVSEAFTMFLRRQKLRCTSMQNETTITNGEEIERVHSDGTANTNKDKCNAAINLDQQASMITKKHAESSTIPDIPPKSSQGATNSTIASTQQEIQPSAINDIQTARPTKPPLPTALQLNDGNNGKRCSCDSPHEDDEDSRLSKTRRISSTSENETTEKTCNHIERHNNEVVQLNYNLVERQTTWNTPPDVNQQEATSISPIHGSSAAHNNGDSFDIQAVKNILSPQHRSPRQSPPYSIPPPTRHLVPIVEPPNSNVDEFNMHSSIYEDFLKKNLDTLGFFIDMKDETNKPPNENHTTQWYCNTD